MTAAPAELLLSTESSLMYLYNLLSHKLTSYPVTENQIWCHGNHPRLFFSPTPRGILSFDARSRTTAIAPHSCSQHATMVSQSSLNKLALQTQDSVLLFDCRWLQNPFQEYVDVGTGASLLFTPKHAILAWTHDEIQYLSGVEKTFIKPFYRVNGTETQDPYLNSSTSRLKLTGVAVDQKDHIYQLLQSFTKA